MFQLYYKAMFIRLCTKHGFVITLKRIKVLDFIISGYLLYTKIFRMVIFGLVFLVYFLKLSVRNVHSIYADFDQSPSLEVRANFLDISKAFNEVWHKGLLYKVKTVGISGNLHKFPESSSQHSVLKLVTSPGRSFTGLNTWAFALLGIYK